MIQEGLLYTLIFSSILAQMDDYTLMTNGMYSTSKLSISNFSAVIYSLLRRMVFTCFNLLLMLRHDHIIRTSIIGGCFLRRNRSNRVTRRTDKKNGSP